MRSTTKDLTRHRATAFAIIRLAYLYNFVNGEFSSSEGTSIMWIMLTIEPGIFLTITNLITLRPLLEKFFPRLRRSHSRKRTLSYTDPSRVAGQSLSISTTADLESGRSRSYTVTKTATESEKSCNEEKNERSTSTAV
jgi:hypothetical protein